MLSVGDVVAGYRIERVLGQGGMGAVYLVANPELPRHEALKLMSVELSKDPGFRARFLREAEVAGRLAHPNIVPIHRRGETAEGQLWIAMQYIDGTDAEQECLDGRMTVQRAVYIIGEVAKALDYAHHNQVIHRDVKPANFLLASQAGAAERVLLADFGIARALDDANLTGTGQMVATLAYAAPEVIAGQALGPATDQYSLACSLFRLLTGRTPFAYAGTQPAILMAHLHQPVPRISEQAPGLPPALDAVIARAMAKDPTQRYRSCTEFTTAVAAAVRPAGTVAWTHSPAPISPVPPPRTPQPRRRGRRATVVSAIVSTVVVAATAIGSLTWLSHRSANTTQPVGPSDPLISAAPTTTAVPPMALERVLLDGEELSRIVGKPAERVGPVDDFMQSDLATVSPDTCKTVFQGSGTASTYVDEEWTSVRRRSATFSDSQVSNSAIGFRSPLAVPEFINRFEFLACPDSTSVKIDGTDTSRPMIVDEPQWIGQLLTITARSSDDRPLTTWKHIWSFHGPIVIETVVLHKGDGEQATAIANAMLAKFPT